MNDSDSNNRGSAEPAVGKGLMIAVAVIATVILLSWAIATVFEIQMIKSFAMVVLVVFGVLVALLLAGVA